ELEKQQELKKVIHEGMTVFDVGAHTGFYTLLFSRAVGPRGKVFAFEPWPGNLVDCLNHLRLNQMHNVTVIPAAVAGTSSMARFSPGTSTSTGHLTNDDALLHVPCLTLDELIATGRVDVPDVVKVDVEGAESQVLDGAKNLLQMHATVWFVALHSSEQKVACATRLADAGYAVSDLRGQKCDVQRPQTIPDEIIAIPSR